MDALMASYASDTDSDGGEPASVSGGAPEVPEPSALLPPPPLDLLQPPNFVGTIPCAPIFLNLTAADVMSADGICLSGDNTWCRLLGDGAGGSRPELPPCGRQLCCTCLYPWSALLLVGLATNVIVLRCECALRNQDQIYMLYPLSYLFARCLFRDYNKLVDKKLGN